MYEFISSSHSFKLNVKVNWEAASQGKEKLWIQDIGNGKRKPLYCLSQEGHAKLTNNKEK